MSPRTIGLLTLAKFSSDMVEAHGKSFRPRTEQHTAKCKVIEKMVSAEGIEPSTY